MNMDTFIYYLQIICIMWAGHSMLIDAYKWIDSKMITGALKLPRIITCSKCFTFWAVLIITLNPFTAAVSSAGVCLLGSIIGYLNINTPIKL
jgi:hypothetical protein